MKQPFFPILFSTAMALCAADETLIQIQSMLPKTTISKIEKAPIENLYYVFLPNGNVIHADVKGRYLIFGEIYTAEGRPVTREVSGKWEQELAQSKIASLPTQKVRDIENIAIKNKIKGRYSLLVFTDPDCPYCKRAEEMLVGKEWPRLIMFMPLRQIHPDSANKSSRFLASSDPMNAYIHADTSSLPTQQATKRLEEMETIAQSFGINGTPTFMIMDTKEHKIVEIVKGANLDQITTWMNKNGEGAKK